MIAFKDFAPQITRKGFFKNHFQSMQDALAEANHWINSHQVQILNVETVVLPEIWREEGTTDPELTTSGDMMNSWYQFIRVWYRQ